MDDEVYRRQIWKRGGRVSAVIERPLDAAAWWERIALGALALEWLTD